MDSTILATIVLGALGILITGYYSRHTKKISDEQLLKQLFTEFNERYSILNDHLKEVENKYKTLSELEKSKDADFLKKNVIDYFSLCAEEYYWYKHKKRIDKLIWVSWQSGMNYWYNKVPAIKDLWNIEVKENGKLTYYIEEGENGFFQEY